MTQKLAQRLPALLHIEMEHILPSNRVVDFLEMPLPDPLAVFSCGGPPVLSIEQGVGEEKLAEDQLNSRVEDAEEDGSDIRFPVQDGFLNGSVPVVEVSDGDHDFGVGISLSELFDEECSGLVESCTEHNINRQNHKVEKGVLLAIMKKRIKVLSRPLLALALILSLHGFNRKRGVGWVLKHSEAMVRRI